MSVKIVTLAPAENSDGIRKAIRDADAGHIGEYSHCSFTTEGAWR